MGNRVERRPGRPPGRTERAATGTSSRRQCADSTWALAGGWTTRACPAGRAADHPLHHRRRLQRALRDQPRRLPVRPAPAARRRCPPAATRPCCASTGSWPPWPTPTSPTPGPWPAATTPTVIGGCFYLMEFVDGWSPIQEGTTWPRAVRHRPRGPARPGLRAGRRHRQAVPGGLARPGASRASASPTASTSARSTAGWPTWRRCSSAPLPGHRRGGGLAAHPPAPLTTSRASCTATTSSPTSCTATAPRPGWPPSSTGRWPPSAIPCSTWAG